MIALTFNDGIIRLGDQEAPGILKQLSIRGKIKFDDATMETKSGTTRIPAGWDDADISATLDLLTDDFGTCYEKLRELHAIFRNADSTRDTEQGQTIVRPPKVYTVINRHMNARGIRKVIFSGLDSSESDADDTIEASLSFTECENSAAQAETRTQASSPQNTGGSVTSSSVTADDEILVA